nr:protein VASP homolog [Rhipicephalus microplus]
MSSSMACDSKKKPGRPAARSVVPQAPAASMLPPSNAPPAPANKPPPRREVATWTFQQGTEAPVAFVSTRRWSKQCKVCVGVDPESVPRPFRGRTLSDLLDASGGASMPPVPEASYCDACGVLLVHEATHLHSRVYRAKSGSAPAVLSTPAVPPGPGLQPAPSTNSIHVVVEALVTDSSFKSAITAVVSAALPRPHVPAETPPNEDTGAPADLVDGTELDLSFFRCRWMLLLRSL